MTRTISTALLLGLLAAFAAPPTFAEPDADTAQVSQPGDTKQFGTIKVTYESVTADGPKADVVLRMDNVGDEQKEIAFMLFVDVNSDAGELENYDYARTRCDGAIPPKGSFECKLALIFPAPPKQIFIKVGEGMAGETVTFNIAVP